MSLFNFSQEPVLVCRDHTVSGLFFELKREENYGLLGTFPQPDEKELPGFYDSQDYISHTDSRNSFLDKIYQGVKTFMLRKKIGWIENEAKQKGRILDIGAGTGDFLLAAKERGWKVFGQEPSPAARSLAAAKGIVLEEQLSCLPDYSFDVITLWHVLEHVPNLEEQINLLGRLLKKDGLLIVAVPNYKSYDAKVYQEHWAAFDVPRHLYHFSRSSIQKFFSEFSFRLVEEKGLLFDSFYVSLLSENHRQGRSNFARAFSVGALSNLKAMWSGEYSSIAYFFRKSEK